MVYLIQSSPPPHPKGTSPAQVTLNGLFRFAHIQNLLTEIDVTLFLDSIKNQNTQKQVQQILRGIFISIDALFFHKDDKDFATYLHNYEIFSTGKSFNIDCI
eukprot:TRINITY_DN48354_c0_g1_i7.p5 TRINITY_DN48354_c0_g1~~TRINITY_DN48354_c0_g1_i7.p5  ORF type:complete len:102 (+),score=0.66 TRINITY_DN48354_c0_g1_i7:1135-1440(+)